MEDLQTKQNICMTLSSFNFRDHWALRSPGVNHSPAAWLLSTFPLKTKVRSVVSDSLRPHGLQPARLLCPCDSPGRILERTAIPTSRGSSQPRSAVLQADLYQLSHQGSLQRLAGRSQGDHSLFSGSVHRCLQTPGQVRKTGALQSRSLSLIALSLAGL